MNEHAPIATTEWTVPSSLHHLLVELMTDPEVQTAPHLWLLRLRGELNAAFAEIEVVRAAGGKLEAYHAACTRVTDAAVAALLHIARIVVDQNAVSMVTPITCVAIGDYPARPRRQSRQAALLLLLPGAEPAKARGRAVADFMVDALHEIGLALAPLVSTVGEIDAQLDRLALLLDRPRFIRGRYDLFVDMILLFENGHGRVDADGANVASLPKRVG